MMIKVTPCRPYSSYSCLEVGRVVAAPLEKVWDLLIDTRCWPQWGPSVRAVMCAERRISLGSQGRVQTAWGFWLPFTVIELLPERYWAWKIGPFRATGHGVRPAGAGRCLLTFDMPLVTAPYGLICGLAAARLARLATAGSRLRP